MAREDLSTIAGVARGELRPDFVLKNANYLNVFTQEFLTGDIAVCDDRFAGIGSYSADVEIDCTGKTVVPGFVDGHVHLESSVIMPLRYAKEVIPRGTTAVITDPHEIANVLGSAGIDYMLQSTADMPLEVYFMIPSCAPATPFDENGAIITTELINAYLDNKRVLGLAEMMNYPGVLARDEVVLDKVYAALKKRKLVDGHAPGLSGADLNSYVSVGVLSDHECSTYEEALEKVRLGQWIMVRQGTAGRNLEALAPLLNGPCAKRCIFVTDDKHPEDLCEQGHIDYIIKKAIEYGVKPEVAFTVASYNAAIYFGLKHKGAIAPGYKADFAILSDRDSVAVESVFKAGRKIAEAGEILEWIKVNVDEDIKRQVENTIHVKSAEPADFAIEKAEEQRHRPCSRTDHHP